MKKSLIYYLSQIKEAYPEITDIKNEEYEKISAEINAQIQAGQPITAHKQLYTKTYRFLKMLARYYAKNGLDYRSFNDNLSVLQLGIMEKLNKKVENKEWFLNFLTYISSISDRSTRYINQFQKEIVFNEGLNTKLVENLLKDEVNKQIYDKELTNAEINELKLILNQALATLRPLEIKTLSYYYGLFGKSEHNMFEIARARGVTREAVRQVISKALPKLCNQNICEFYKSDF